MTAALKRTALLSYDHYIAGRTEAPLGGKYFETENPYTGETWARIARGDGRDVHRAVAAAKAAFPGWAAIKPSQRGRLLLSLADEIEADALHLAEIEVRDNGKLFAEMSAQTRYIAQWYRYYAGLADKLEGAVIPTDKSDIFNFTQYEPLGVIGMITPWNSPLLLLTWKLAPALAAASLEPRHRGPLPGPPGPAALARRHRPCPVHGDVGRGPPPAHVSPSAAVRLLRSP